MCVCVYCITKVEYHPSHFQQIFKYNSSLETTNKNDTLTQ